MEDPTTPQSSDDSKPPFLGSWKAVYALVIANLTILILLFYWFTRAFND